MCKLKGTEKLNHCKNCILCIRGKATSTSHYKYDMMYDAQAKNRVPKV